MPENTTDSDTSDTERTVEMREGLWDAVIHALEEEMVQLAPQEENWLGKYPGEESATLYEQAHAEISRSLEAESNQETKR